VIFDTDFLIAHTKGAPSLSKSRARAFLDSLDATEPLLFAQVTWMEFAAGYESQSLAVSQLDQFVMLPFEGSLWWGASRIIRDLGLRGERIGTPDCMIAATAIAYGQSLVTLNQSHFCRIAGLRVIAPV